MMNIEEYYKQEHDVKPAEESCFANVAGITYHAGEIENEDIFSKEQLTAFAEAYHQSQLKLLGIHGVVFSEAELKAKLDQQKEEMRQWLEGEGYELLAERL